MPKLADTTGSQMINLKGGFKYSNTAIEKLDASNYTLGTLVVDVTGSLGGRENDLTRIMREIVKKLKGEDTARNILWRVVIFSSAIGVEEVHGFKLLMDIDPDADYPVVNCFGGTALFDAVGSAIDATVVEAQRLDDEEYDSNAILVFLTDGDDNDSRVYPEPKNVKEKVVEAMRSEALESIRTILVGVNPDGLGSSSWKQVVSQKLSEFHAEADLTEYVDMEDFTDDTIKKIILQVSSITSDTSKMLGSGGPSQLTF